MRVLISGAGIAGPTLAWWLARTGTHVTIIEKANGLPAYGQNLDVEDSAVTVIKKMGLWDQVRRFNTTERGTQFIDPKGRSFAHFPVKDGRFCPTSENEIMRGDLVKILYEATKDHPNVDYVFGTTIEGVVSNNDVAVTVKLSIGKVLEIDVLVAADGQWSKVRKQCFPPESVRLVDKGMYAVHFTAPHLPDDNEWWNIYQALGSRIIGVRPDPYGTTRAAFTRMPCTDAQRRAWQSASRSDRKTQQALLRSEFEDAGWQAKRLLDAMEQAPDLYFQAIQQIKMSKWSKGRVVCVGDAAYCPSPLTGMGVSLAVIGAYVLAGELSKLDAGEHPVKALDAYEGTFRPFVEVKQQIPSIVPGILHPETAWRRWLFQTVMSAVSVVVATSWLTKIFASSKDDNFPLPQYSSFGDKSSH